MTANQITAFTNATAGVSPDQFQLTVLLIFFSIMYLWLGWMTVTQWKAWSNKKISFYDFLLRSARGVLVVLLASFFLT